GSGGTSGSSSGPGGRSRRTRTMGPHEAGVEPGASEPTQPEMRLGAAYAATRVLAESASLAEATPQILRVICESLGWEHGALWRVDEPANVLRCVEIWGLPSLSFPQFDELSRHMTFTRGVGLP